MSLPEFSQSPASLAGSKRKLPPNPAAQRASFPRKRAHVACDLCRARKTKCGNERPACRRCRDLGSPETCHYPDQTSHASFDPASLTILDRLEYLISVVELDRHTSGGTSLVPDVVINKGHDQPPPAHVNVANAFTPGAIGTPSSQTPTRNIVDDRLPHYFHGSSEDILDWPVFQSKHNREQIERLIFNPVLHSEVDYSSPISRFSRVSATSPQDGEHLEGPRRRMSSLRGIREEDVSDLVDRFLANVHTKNPILDAQALRGIVKTIAAEGFGWDARSCLVLLACACAAISTPFARMSIDGRESNASLDDTPDYATAEAYYDAARHYENIAKRIGLLNNTQLATECYFVAGVYEMYSMRPLRASISFNRACVAFQALTWMRSEHCLDESKLEKAQKSRLYWSCLKSEHEIMVELRFPASGLTTLNYTQAFPPPPEVNANVQSSWHPSENQQAASIGAGKLAPELERSWYYYLADIAVRRILQRVFDLFYRTSHNTWVQQDFARLVWSAEELDQQLSQWRENLPEPVAFRHDSFADEELSFHLQARFVEVRERIFRPFLYIAIHGPEQISSQIRDTELVQKHISACLGLIRHWNVTHRHHGTWLMVRQSFAAGLLLVAAQRSGLTLAQISDDELGQALQTCLATLRYWEREAPDLAASRLILDDMAADLLQ